MDGRIIQDIFEQFWFWNVFWKFSESAFFLLQDGGILRVSMTCSTARHFHSGNRQRNSFFFNTKFIRAPRFWGCFFKDRNASQHIERKKVALVKTWHTRQGVYRKKIQPDVRDDLRSLRHLQEGATSWRSTYESWVALSVEFHLVLTHRYSWEFPPRVFLFFFVVFVWLLVAFDFKLSQAFCIFPCMKSLQQDKSGNDRQCLSHDL